MLVVGIVGIVVGCNLAMLLKIHLHVHPQHLPTGHACLTSTEHMYQHKFQAIV